MPRMMLLTRVGFRNEQSRYPRARKRFEKKKIYRKKKIFFKMFRLFEKISKKNSTSKLIFLLRSKKIHFEVDVFHFEVKKSTSKLKIF